LSTIPESAAHALGTDRFEAQCLLETDRHHQWAALFSADQFLWLSTTDSILDANGGTTALDRLLARHNDDGNHGPSTLELSIRTYSLKHHEGRSSRGLFGGINQYPLEQVEDCRGVPRSSNVAAVAAAAVLTRRANEARTGPARGTDTAGSNGGDNSTPILRLDPAEAHVKEWPWLSTGLAEQRSAIGSDAAEPRRSPAGEKTEDNNCTIAYLHDSDLHGWVQSVDESFRRRTGRRSEARENQPTIYFVVTASLWVPAHQEGVADPEVRLKQYPRGIKSLLNSTASGFPLPHKVIVVENNGHRPTPFDEIDGVSVLYTDNNQNDMHPFKGTKEVLDVLACVEHFGMRDHDLVVKMTGRYYLDYCSHFLGLLRNIDWATTQALVKFGPYLGPTNVPQDDCITGLIMLPVSAVRQIDRTKSIIERAWARAVLTHVPASAVHAIQGPMGIHIAPGGAKDYFLV
jgi:hypothetical protein